MFEKLLNLISNIHKIKLDNILEIDCYKNNYLKKLQKRFENKTIYNFEDADKIYDIIVSRLNEYFKRMQNNIVSVIHGDFWFSNIILTYKDEYKFIDMKGIVDNNLSLSGDKIYDYAKIMQSLVCFDYILNNNKIQPENNIFINFYKKWINENDPDINFDDIFLICATLIFGVFEFHEIKNKNLIIELVKKLILE